MGEPSVDLLLKEAGAWNVAIFSRRKAYFASAATANVNTSDFQHNMRKL